MSRNQDADAQAALGSQATHDALVDAETRTEADNVEQDTLGELWNTGNEQPRTEPVPSPTTGDRYPPPKPDPLGENCQKNSKDKFRKPYDCNTWARKRINETPGYDLPKDIENSGFRANRKNMSADIVGDDWNMAHAVDPTKDNGYNGHVVLIKKILMEVLSLGRWDATAVILHTMGISKHKKSLNKVILRDQVQNGMAKVHLDMHL